MHIKLPYISGRPILLAKLSHQDSKPRYFKFLVDSGADYTLISNSTAFLIGINYHSIKQKPTKIELANLTHIEVKLVQLKIFISSKMIKIPAWVTNIEIMNLLGRKGIFNKFDILFQETQQQVIFKPIS